MGRQNLGDRTVSMIAMHRDLRIGLWHTVYSLQTTYQYCTFKYCTSKSVVLVVVCHIFSGHIEQARQFWTLYMHNSHIGRLAHCRYLTDEICVCVWSLHRLRSTRWGFAVCDRPNPGAVQIWGDRIAPISHCASRIASIHYINEQDR